MIAFEYLMYDSQKKYKSAVFWLLAASGLLLAADASFPGPIPAWLFAMQLSLPFLSISLHAACNLGWLKMSAFIALSGIVGWIFEFIGLSFGTVFGGHYSYSDLGPEISGVPLVVLAYWFGFIYTAYCLTNIYLKPAVAKAFKKPALWLAAADGAWITAIDLFLDPVMVTRGAWRWLDGGLYFNIPLGNFCGWFLVGFLVSLFFRQIPLGGQESDDRQLRLAPVIGYCLIVASLVGFSHKLGLKLEMLVGCLMMIIPLILAIIIQKNKVFAKLFNI